MISCDQHHAIGGYGNTKRGIFLCTTEGTAPQYVPARVELGQEGVLRTANGRRQRIGCSGCGGRPISPHRVEVPGTGFNGDIPDELRVAGVKSRSPIPSGSLCACSACEEQEQQKCHGAVWRGSREGAVELQ